MCKVSSALAKLESNNLEMCQFGSCETSDLIAVEVNSLLLKVCYLKLRLNVTDQKNNFLPHFFCGLSFIFTYIWIKNFPGKTTFWLYWTKIIYELHKCTY